MNVEEYATMFSVEDGHWWYLGLRGMIDLFWRRCVTAERPRVLDAGCGTGALLERLGTRAEACGVDVSHIAVQFCRRRGVERSAAASVTALPFPAATFDVAVSFDVFCHRSIPDKRVPFREVHRALKPGGLFLLNLPAYQWLHSSHDVAVHTDRRFTKGEVLRLLRESDFEPLHATYWNTLLFPPVVATRLWRRMFPPKGSDLDTDWEGVSNRVFAAILRLERGLVRVAPLPFGLSVFAVGRKA